MSPTSHLAVILAIAPAAVLGANSTLRDAAKSHGVFMGAALNTGNVKSNKIYKDTAAAQYSLVTAENACKFSGTEPIQGKYNYDGCDEIRDFTKNVMNGTFRCHNLVWGMYNPSWLSKLSATEKRVAMINHIGNVTEHYGNDCYAWDVVNEAITDSSNATDPLKHSTW